MFARGQARRLASGNIEPVNIDAPLLRHQEIAARAIRAPLGSVRSRGAKAAESCHSGMVIDGSAHIAQLASPARKQVQMGGATTRYTQILFSHQHCLSSIRRPGKT